jgi:hypothetical protein
MDFDDWCRPGGDRRTTRSENQQKAKALPGRRASERISFSIRDLIVKRRVHKVYLYAFPMVAVFQVFSMQRFHSAVAGFPKGISRSLD